MKIGLLGSSLLASLTLSLVPSAYGISISPVAPANSYLCQFQETDGKSLQLEFGLNDTVEMTFDRYEVNMKVDNGYILVNGYSRSDKSLQFEVNQDLKKVSTGTQKTKFGYNDGEFSFSCVQVQKRK